MTVPAVCCRHFPQMTELSSSERTRQRSQKMPWHSVRIFLCLCCRRRSQNCRKEFSRTAENWKCFSFRRACGCRLCQPPCSGEKRAAIPSRSGYRRMTSLIMKKRADCRCARTGGREKSMAVCFTVRRKKRERAGFSSNMCRARSGENCISFWELRRWRTEPRKAASHSRR